MIDLIKTSYALPGILNSNLWQLKTDGNILLNLL